MRRRGARAQAAVVTTTTVPAARDAADPPQPGLVLAGRAAPRSRWPWPAQALLCPVLLLAALIVPASLSLVPGMDRLDAPSTPVSVAAAVMVGLCLSTTLLAVGVVALLLRLDGGRRLADVGWRLDRRTAAMLVLGMVISAVVVVAVGIPLTAAGLLRTEDASLAGDPVGAVLVVGLSQAFLLQAIPEELIFRGYLLGSLRMRPVLAVLTSGLVFGALHLASSGGQQGWGERMVYLADPIGFGLAAGALSLLTGSLWVAVGIHGGAHATLLSAELLERVDPAFAIGNGPASWLLTGLLYTVVAVVAMVAYARRSEPAVGSAA